MSTHYFNNQKKTNIIKKKIIHIALKKHKYPRHRKDQQGRFAYPSRVIYQR